MDMNTRQEISRIVEFAHDEATREFAEVKSAEPYDTHVCAGDDPPERVRVIGDGIRLGLCEYYRSERISVTIVETGYQIRIKRA